MLWAKGRDFMTLLCPLPVAAPLGGVFIRGHTQGRWVMDERDVSQQIKRAGEEGARRNN